MNKENLTKLWQWISLGCFAYVVGSVISIQGGVDVFGAKLFADKKTDGIEVLAYFAVVVGAFLLSVALLVAILYAKRHGDAWHSRIPVIFLEGLDTSALESKIYQAIIVLIFVLLPLYGVGKSILVANQGVLCEQVADKEAPHFFGFGHWQLAALPPHKDQMRLMKHDTAPGVCGGSGVEVSWYTPVAFVGLPVLAIVLLIVWLGFLFRIKKQDASGARLVDSEQAQPTKA